MEALVQTRPRTKTVSSALWAVAWLPSLLTVLLSMAQARTARTLWELSTELVAPCQYR